VLKARPRIFKRYRRGAVVRFVVAGAIVLGAGVAFVVMRSGEKPDLGGIEVSSQSTRRSGVFYPTATQWAALMVQPVAQRAFRSEVATDGKLAIDEDRATPIFSPYSGRVRRLAVKPGDTIERGQLLFIVEAADMVQAQNDFIAAIGGLNKAKAQLNLAQIVEKRQHDLYDGKAAPLKDWQQSQNDLIGAQNDLRSAEIAFDAVRNRLRILGKTDDDIAAFRNTGAINPETMIYSPIAGTVVQRKVGPGQYVSNASSDPVFVVGDLSTVWLLAQVRESDASKVRLGQTVEFRVLAYPDRVFSAKIIHVAASVDPNTRRIPVRATIDNPGLLLKPEMFASVNIVTSDEADSPAVPRSAVIYEGDTARVWVATDDKSIELRRVTLGLSSGNMIQVNSGLEAGEKVVTKGSLFIDRASAGDTT
jgi:membrane fusion protein, heavy metal efflux system